jgi:hypothetical protein
MKNKILSFIALAVFVNVLAARNMVAGQPIKPVSLPRGEYQTPQRVPPSYTFTQSPTSVITNYYDYMIGSYNGFPLRVIPNSAGGGYFMTYHGKRHATALRRVFYCYIDQSGLIINNNEINTYQNNEGYPTLAVDPVAGKPVYAWHLNADTDALFEVQYTSDAFLASIAGLFNVPEMVIDNSPDDPDSEFIWPTAQIGPSPVAGKRRIYIVARNALHNYSYGPSENPRIAYADFDGTDIEYGTPLTWSYTSIPEMDDWNQDMMEWRRPFFAIAADNSGNLYYAGYHFATQMDGTTVIPEADMDVFVCPNYGEGVWTWVSDFSNLSAWNPPASPGGTSGYFTDLYGVPYGDGELYFKMNNSTHFNAAVDNIGRIHVLGLWGLQNSDGEYYPDLQFVKEFIYDPVTLDYEIREVHPKKAYSDTFNQCFMPWDAEAPWGEVDEYGGDAGSGYYPLMVNDWPFPHWDETAHYDEMMFHYSNTKLTNANSEGMMAAIWQNSQRSRLYNYYSDSDYFAFANTPEIHISVSPNNGDTWSEPIVLNNVETPEFNGIKPMWAYPADKIIYTGMQGANKVGKLGLMFYDDYTWGSNSISPSYHPVADGGRVMFAELEIVFPDEDLPPDDPFGDPVVLSGSMSVAAEVSIYGDPASDGDVLAAYVDVGGAPQLRGKETIEVFSGVAGCLIQIYTETNGENITFKVWDHSENVVLDAAQSLESEVNGIVGSWPYDLFQITAPASLTVAIPTFDPVAGTYQQAENVFISCATDGATIHYTTDGSDPTQESTIYTQHIHIPLNTTMTIKARAYRTGWTPSPVASATYVITGTVAPPGFDPPPGTYPQSQDVTLTCATDGATIHYTTDGSDPNQTSAVYTEPINIPDETSITIKAKGYKPDWIPGPIATGTYQIVGTVATPTFDPEPGHYYEEQDVQIQCAFENATIRYTTDGADPTEDSPAYTEPIHIPLDTTLTLKARGYRDGFTPSDIIAGIYEVTGTVAAIGFDPFPATYPQPLNVTLSCATDGATIHYTTDGSDPTENSAVFEDPISIPEDTSMTIKARGYKTGWMPGPVSTGAYTVSTAVATPTFGPEPGLYYTTQEVTIQCDFDGATIHYTTDGTDPTEDSPVYETQILIPLDTTVTLKARGYRHLFLPSEIATGVYDITGTVATPTFYPPPGLYLFPLDVFLNCATAGATIRYTINNTTPNENSTIYTSPIHIPDTTVMTIRAKAFLDDWLPSEIATGHYNVNVGSQDDLEIPAATGIASVYPNPFKDTATIRLGIKENTQHWRMSIFNIRGECVSKFEGTAKGWINVDWDGRDLNNEPVAPGVYLLRFTTGNHQSTGKILLGN